MFFLWILSREEVTGQNLFIGKDWEKVGNRENREVGKHFFLQIIMRRELQHVSKNESLWKEFTHSQFRLF